MAMRTEITEKVPALLRAARTRETVIERNGSYFRTGRYFLALALFFSLAVSTLFGQARSEILLSTETAYNPIPSPDGKMIAYVRTGWGRKGGSGGVGRSNLISEVAVIADDGKPITAMPLTDTFLAGWTPDGTALVCYRDWEYGLITLTGERTLQGELRQLENAAPTERVFYSSRLRAIAWSRVGIVGAGSDTVLATRDHIVAEHPGWLGEVVVPSPDGRYLAIFDDEWQKDLWVYDMQSSRWFDLGPLTVHPDKSWGYMQASWNPWFSDSSHLAYFSGSSLVISTADGSVKRTIAVDGQGGLATPSPDGKFVAYLTFDPRPMNSRPDLKFWGGTIIWVMPLASGSKPFAVTQKNSATTYDLRWLGNNAIAFDRFEDEAFPEHARIWRVAIRGAAN
jgi:hypothetical protein